MSYPTDLPVRERVLANLVTTLQAMGPPTTVHAFNSVQRWGGAGGVIQAPAHPAAIVIPVVETSDQSRHAIIEHELDVAITMALRDADWQTSIEQLASDVRVAVLADYSRGGAAMDTRLLSTEIFDAGNTDKPIAAAQVNLRVVYRTLFTDPSEAH